MGEAAEGNGCTCGVNLTSPVSNKTRLVLGVVDAFEPTRLGLCQVFAAHGEIMIAKARASVDELLAEDIDGLDGLDLVVVDGNAVDELSLHLISTAAAQRGDLTWVVTSDVVRLPLVRAALRAGVRGWIRRRGTTETFASILRVIHDGQIVVDSSMTRFVERDCSETSSRRGRAEELTAKERQLFHLVGGGFTNREIGSFLGLSEKTVKNYLYNIYGKLGARSRVE